MKKILSSLALFVVFTTYIYYRRISPVNIPGPVSQNPVFSVSSSLSSSIDPPPPVYPVSSSPVPPPVPARVPAPPVKTNPPPPPPASVPNPPPPPIASSPAAQNPSGYRDGNYTGAIADAYYGNVQVQATIKNGRLADVRFLQYPNDRSHSIEINSYAMPLLKSEAIQAQSASVNIVSGATETSLAFNQSLASALAQAK